MVSGVDPPAAIDRCLNYGEPGNTRVEFDEDEKWIRVKRGEILVLCNLGERGREFPVPANSSLLLGSLEGTAIQNDRIVLGPDGVAIVRVEQVS